jgi:cell division protein FtsL
MNPSLSFHNQRVTRLVQAYRQAPWRTQRQWIVLFLLVVVAIGMVAGLYLNVTARAALAGREVQSLEQEIADIERQNSDLQTQIAAQLSTTTMAQRAQALGFEPATAENLEYLPVNGYFPSQPVSLGSSTSGAAQQSTISPLYTESLLDWLNSQIGAASLP